MYVYMYNYIWFHEKTSGKITSHPSAGNTPLLARVACAGNLRMRVSLSDKKRRISSGCVKASNKIWKNVAKCLETNRTQWIWLGNPRRKLGFQW